MTAEQKLVACSAQQALSGHGAHACTAHVFEGVDWKMAGKMPRGAPHTLFQLMGHMTYWQNWAVKWLDGKKPTPPRHAAGSWPSSSAPVSAEDWKHAVKRYERGLETLEKRCTKPDLFARKGKKTALEMIQAIASHNSYHAGQAAFLRRQLGAWPPPAGGLSW